MTLTDIIILVIVGISLALIIYFNFINDSSKKNRKYNLF